MERYDIAIIGGGIVGMATALALMQKKAHKLVVLEAENRLCVHQTGHNSGVIHSGIYYKPGSLKALNCAKGREALYRFCEEHNIKHERCGKIIIASTKAEIVKLDELERRGVANGLTGLKRIPGEAIREYEPYAVGMAALWVPQTGIVDYFGVTETYASIIQQNGGEIRKNTRFLGMKKEAGFLRLQTSQGEIETKFLVNCAGLHCDRIAKLCGVKPNLKIVPFRGEYFILVPERKDLLKNMIYPVPDPEFPFLGVHFTRRVTGVVEAGPNAVLAFKREGYNKTSFSLRDTLETLTYKGFCLMGLKHWKMGFYEMYRSLCKAAFVKALQRMIPSVQSQDLIPGGAGVRAQAVEPDGKLVDDFRIVESENMVHVLNAPSPAATASISIGESIAEIVEKRMR